MLKQINKFNINFYHDGATVGKDISKLIENIELPLLFNPTKFDENDVWLLYTVEGFKANDDDMMQVIELRFSNDQANKAIRDLYELAELEPFTVSVQLLDDNDVAIEVLTFNNAEVDQYVPDMLVKGMAQPHQLVLRLNFENIVHSFRK